MNLGTVFVLLIVVGVVGFALRSVVKSKESCHGGSDGGRCGCEGCSQLSCSCSSANLEQLMR